MYFITVWLRKGDNEETIAGFKRVMQEAMAKCCGGVIGEIKISEKGNRLTAIPFCSERECQKTKGTVETVTNEIREKTNRTAKGIGSCGRS